MDSYVHEADKFSTTSLHSNYFLEMEIDHQTCHDQDKISQHDRWILTNCNCDMNILEMIADE